MEKLDKFLELINIIKTLRAPGGCDWDREQTHASLIPYLTEETYEVIEAIESNDSESLKEETRSHILESTFSTLTNVNFSEDRMVEYIHKTIDIREQIKPKFREL